MATESIDIATYAAMGSAVFAGAALIFNAISLGRTTRNEYLKLIKDYQNDIIRLDRSESQKFKDSQDQPDHYKYELWGYEYLNLDNQIAYFAVKGLISVGVTQYFNASFRRALPILDEHPFNTQHYKGKFKTIERWCDEQNIGSQNSH